MTAHILTPFTWTHRPTENGPFTVTPVDAETITVVKSDYSWNQIAHVLYVETPIGTGNSQGEPRLHNEGEFAAELHKWYTQWLEVFPEFKKKKLWIWGERCVGGKTKADDKTPRC